MSESHDEVEVITLSHDGVAIDCSCGKRIVDTDADKAHNRHARHRQLETARAALRGDAR